MEIEIKIKPPLSHMVFVCSFRIDDNDGDNDDDDVMMVTMTMMMS